MQNLLDGVKEAMIHHTAEVKMLSEMVKDKGLSLVDRTESFEDIFNLEVGDTNLTRVRALEREYDIRQLFINFDLRFSQINNGKLGGYPRMVLITFHRGVPCYRNLDLAAETESEYEK